MAQAPYRRLKVFQAQFGFHESVVAAPSQPAALKAWGVRQNLFAEGLARVTDDAQAVEAALAHPLTPLRRAVGSSDRFALVARAPDVPDAPRRTTKPARLEPTPAPRAPPDRTPLDAAEARLREIDAAWKRQDEDLRRRQQNLEAERRAAKALYDAARKAATSALAETRKAYRQAGGDV